MVDSGQLTPDSLVWTEGMADWQPLSAVGAGGAPEGVAAEQQAHLNVQRAREGVAGAGLHNVEYGGFWIRFAGYLIDYVIVTVAMLVLILPLSVLGAFSGSEAAELGIAILTQLIALAGVICYNGIMIGRYGWTLGKRAVGLRVICPDGSPVSMGRAFGRAAAEILSGMICGIGYIIAAFDEEKRTLHDHIATTRVIRDQ